MSGVLIGINLGRSGQFWTDAMVKRFKHFFLNVPSCTVTRDCSVLKSDGVEVLSTYRDYL